MIWSREPEPTKTTLKLQSFAELPVGWHYGKGSPIAPEVLAKAAAVYQRFVMVGLTKTDAFPGVNGEVLVTGYFQGHYVGVEIEANGSFSIVHEKAGEECCELDNLNWASLMKALVKVAEEIWGSSDSSIQSTGKPISTALATSPSRNLLTETGCLSSTRAVRVLQAA